MLYAIGSDGEYACPQCRQNFSTTDTFFSHRKLCRQVLLVKVREGAVADLNAPALGYSSTTVAVSHCFCRCAATCLAYFAALRGKSVRKPTAQPLTSVLCVIDDLTYGRGSTSHLKVMCKKRKRAGSSSRSSNSKCLQHLCPDVLQCDH